MLPWLVCSSSPQPLESLRAGMWNPGWPAYWFDDILHSTVLEYQKQKETKTKWVYLWLSCSRTSLDDILRAPCPSGSSLMEDSCQQKKQGFVTAGAWHPQHVQFSQNKQMARINALRAGSFWKPQQALYFACWAGGCLHFLVCSQSILTAFFFPISPWDLF